MGDHLHWIYEIHFDRTYPADVAVFGADYFDMPVLMDGRVTPLRGYINEPFRPNQIR